MKRKTIIILGLFLLLAGFLHAQDTLLTYRFANPIIKAGSPDTLIFDVQVKCNVTGTYHTDLSVYINYNTAAFGESVVANGKFILVRSGLSASEVIPGSGLYKYGFLPIVDNTSSRVVFGTEPEFASAYSNLTYLSLVPNTFINYVRVKLVISNSTQLAGLNFQADLMNGNQFYLTSPGIPIAYDNCVFNNDFNQLPLNPNTSLIISEVAEPSDSQASFVEIYNAGPSALDFDAYYPWFLNVNGSSSVQLTGTLSAGGTYVIANDATDFTTAYPGKSYDLVSNIVGNSGTENYLLTTYGNYSDGISIDIYNGSAGGFGFPGKHAVRHYPVVSPNTTLTAAEWVITSAQNADMTPGSHRATLTWVGASSSAWRNSANWTPQFVPDAGHNAVVPGTVIAVPALGNGESAFCHDLSVSGELDGMGNGNTGGSGESAIIIYGAKIAPETKPGR